MLNTLSISIQRRGIGPILVGLIVGAAAIVFLVYPIGNVIAHAFVANGKELTLDNLTLKNFERFFISASYRNAFWNSIMASGGATLLAVALSLPMAYATTRARIWGRPLVLALSVIPLIAPPFIGAYAWVMLLGNNGMITQMLVAVFGIRPPSIYGPFGVVVALALSYFPYLFLIVQGALAAADPSIEEAAQMTGASRWRIVRTITFPMIVPSIASGALIVFIKAIGDFGVPAILGGEFQVLPTLIYYQIHGYFNLNAGAAIAMVNVSLTIAALWLLSAVSRRWSVATITGSSRGANQFRGPGATLVANLFIWSILILALAPQLVVLIYSFAERWGDTLLPSAYGLENYRRVLVDVAQPIWNTLVLSTVATAVCLVFGVMTAYAAVRGKALSKWLLDLLVMVPFVLPGLVVGVAYLTAFNGGWIVLTGTASILILAYFTRRVGFVFRSASAAIGQVDPLIEQASTICGASWGTTMRRITVPLIAPALVAAGVLVFATLIGEISATVLLYSAKWKTLSISIYEFVLGNDIAKASALGTLSNLMTLVLVLGASMLLGRNMSDMFR